MPAVPEPLREVYIIVMRVGKSSYLVPNPVKLGGAMRANFVECRQLIYLLTSAKHRHKQLMGGKVGQGLALPGEVRVKYLIGSGCRLSARPRCI